MRGGRELGTFQGRRGEDGEVGKGEEGGGWRGREGGGGGRMER